MQPQANRPNKILVVDDDARIRDLLRRYLTQEGFEVLLAEDGKSLTRIMLRETVDLIVLDLMMPGEDGLSICRRLRAANDVTPVIMLTAKGEDIDRIVGLEVGADDYLGKPFNPRELLARIHAVLRRRPTQEAPGAPSSDNEVVKFGSFVFDLGLRTLKKQTRKSPSPPANSPCSRRWCVTRASRCRARNWPSCRAGASLSLLTAAWTYRYPACAKCWRPTRPRPASSRLYGAWATYLCPMKRPPAKPR